jgi:excisionase family DNA binding protein
MSTKTKKKPARKPRARIPRSFGTLGFLPIEEVARRLGFSKSSVWALIGEGEIKATRFSPRIIRVHEDALAEYVQKMKGSFPAQGEAKQA